LVRTLDLGGIFLKSFDSGRLPIIDLLDGRRKICGQIFLNDEANLMRSGCSSMEVMSRFTSMQVELGLEKSGQLEFLDEEIPAKFILLPTCMEILLILI
jgi:hypothetical protein